jgi:hypothetical protein
VRNSSLTGSDVKDKSLSARDFSGSLAGPVGAQGAKGDTGAPGSPGAPGAAGDKGDPGPLLDVLPSGRTIKGVYTAMHEATAPGEIFAETASFQFPMPSNLLTPHFVSSGGLPPAACAAGSPGEPKAAPGHLCVFETNDGNATLSGIVNPAAGGTGVSKYGFVLEFTSNGSGLAVSRGTWAATAP